MRRVNLNNKIYLGWGTLLTQHVESVILEGSASGFRELVEVLKIYSPMPRATVQIDVMQDPTDTRPFPYLLLHVQDKIDWRLVVAKNESGIEFVELSANAEQIGKLIATLERQLHDSYCPSEMYVGKRNSKEYRRSLLWVQLTDLS